MSKEEGRITLTDVAREAGVSRMTASYTFGKPDRVATATRKKVLAAAERLGFQGPDPSGRLLRTGALRSLGLVLGESLEYVFEDPEATKFVAGMARECTAAGYGLTIIPTTGDEPDAAHISSAAVDAFVVWATTPDDPALGAIRDTRRRAVVHGGPDADGFSLIGIDDRAAAKALALAVWQDAAAPAVLSFALDLARAAGIQYGIDPDAAALPVTHLRLAGFQDAAIELGLAWNSIPIAVCTRNGATDAEAAARSLAASGYPVDALVAMSDLQAIAARGVLGEGVRFGGFDGSDAAIAQGVSSIHQSLESHGARAARIALGREPESHETSEEWTLIASTKP